MRELIEECVLGHADIGGGAPQLHRALDDADSPLLDRLFKQAIALFSFGKPCSDGDGVVRGYHRLVHDARRWPTGDLNGHADLMRRQVRIFLSKEHDLIAHEEWRTGINRGGKERRGRF